MGGRGAVWRRAQATLCPLLSSHSRQMLVIFEGRDAAGKGGVIKKIPEPLNQRGLRVVALPAPTDAEKTQWYFQANKEWMDGRIVGRGGVREGRPPAERARMLSAPSASTCLPQHTQPTTLPNSPSITSAT